MHGPGEGRIKNHRDAGTDGDHDHHPVQVGDQTQEIAEDRRCTQTDKHVHTHSYIHTDTHTCIHTQMHARPTPTHTTTTKSVGPPITHTHPHHPNTHTRMHPHMHAREVIKPYLNWTQEISKPSLSRSHVFPHH